MRGARCCDLVIIGRAAVKGNLGVSAPNSDRSCTAGLPRTKDRQEHPRSRRRDRMPQATRGRCIGIAHVRHAVARALLSANRRDAPRGVPDGGPDEMAKSRSFRAQEVSGRSGEKNRGRGKGGSVGVTAAVPDQPLDVRLGIGCALSSSSWTSGAVTTKKVPAVMASTISSPTATGSTIGCCSGLGGGG